MAVFTLFCASTPACAQVQGPPPPSGLPENDLYWDSRPGGSLDGSFEDPSNWGTGNSESDQSRTDFTPTPADSIFIGSGDSVVGSPTVNFNSSESSTSAELGGDLRLNLDGNTWTLTAGGLNEAQYSELYIAGGDEGGSFSTSIGVGTIDASTGNIVMTNGTVLTTDSGTILKGGEVFLNGDSTADVASGASFTSGDNFYIGHGDFLPGSGAEQPEPQGTFTQMTVEGAVSAQNYLYVGDVDNGNLVIKAGGTVTNTIGIVGEQASSFGTATVQGTWTNSSYFYVGDNGNGDVNVNGGGQLSSTFGFIAAVSGSVGTVDVGNQGKWTLSQSLYIGQSGTGTVTVENGGELSVAGDTIDLGFNAGSTGTLTFDGTGGSSPTLTFTPGSTGQLVIGDGGTGNFTVKGGAQIRTDAEVILGNQTGSTGTATVTGAGSMWTVAESLSIGSEGTGSVTLSDGGTLEVDGPSLLIGSKDGTGTLTITGSSGDGDDASAVVNSGRFHTDAASLTTNLLMTAAGSDAVVDGTLDVEDGADAKLTADELSLGANGGTGTMNITGGSGGLLTRLLMTQAGSAAVAAMIGDSGTGIFNVSGGSQVTIDGVITVGNGAGSTGTLTLSDPNTSMDIDQDPIIGMDGTGGVTIQGGAGLTVTDGDTILGQDATGLGTLYVQDAGTTLQMGGNLIVGGASTLGNDFQVTGGGLAMATGNGTVGRDAGSNGTIEVNGSGSSLQVTDLTIGQSGTGGVTISAGGTLQVGGDLIIGQNQGSTGSLTLDGSDTTFNYTGGDIVVGSAGTGTMTIQNGILVDLSGNGVTLGDENTGNGTLIVSDNDTQLNTGDMTVGGSGTGTLTVKDNATLTSDSATVGDEQESNGTATVTGDGSTWTVSNLTVGGGGTGQLDIDNGGTVSASGDKLTLGDESTGDGTITLGDAGSALKFTGEIDDGENGKGVLAVQGGASFTAFTMNIGDKGTGNGIFNVDGSGTTAEVQQDLNVGESGTGALNVTNGAHLLDDSDATLADLGGSGTAVVDSSAVWTIGGDLSVGHQGIGGLQVSGGGYISASNITLGEIAGGGAGTATVFGKDTTGPSTLEYDNVLKVGDGGSGVLIVDSGGTVKNSGKGTEADSGSVDIAAQTGSKGQVSVDGAGSSLSATSINVGGTATATGGTGSLSATNGGSITASGAVTVQAKGSVAIEANSTLTAAGGVMINAGGSLGGGGTIKGNVVNAGTVAPGDPQTTTIEGNYTEVAGGILTLSLAGARPGDYDQLDVTGELSLETGSTLKLNFIDGFAPTIGETFDLIQYGTLDLSNANFTTVDITGLEAGFDYAIVPLGTGGTDFQLTALNDGIAATPEPSTWALLIIGFSLLAFVSPRLRAKGRHSP